MQALDDACETLARVMRVRQSSAVALPPGAAHVVERTLVPNQNGWSEDVSAVINRIRASRAVVSSSARDASNEDAWIDLGSSFDESDSPDVRSALESLGRAAGVEAPSMVLDQFEAMTMERDGSPGEEDLSMDGVVDAMLLGGDSMEPVRKVVLARRSKLSLNAPVDSFALVSRLQARDPDAYQFVLRHPNGETFLGSTPERLFLSRKSRAVSEAVAGTPPEALTTVKTPRWRTTCFSRPRNTRNSPSSEKRCAARSAKSLRGGNGGVEVELEKGILRHVAVQHLYSRLSAPLAEGKNEADLIAALHPTPAVCGYPRKAALEHASQG